MVVVVALVTSVPTAQAEVCNEKPCITVTPCLTAGFSNQLNLLSQSKEKIKYKKKYAKGTYVNIREQPSKNSEVIKQVSFNERVIIIGNKLTNGCWYTVDLNDKTGYIHKDYVSDKTINYKIYNVPYAKIRLGCHTQQLPVDGVNSISFNRKHIQVIMVFEW